MLFRPLDGAWAPPNSSCRAGPKHLPPPLKGLVEQDHDEQMLTEGNLNSKTMLIGSHNVRCAGADVGCSVTGLQGYKIQYSCLLLTTQEVNSHLYRSVQVKRQVV